MASRSLDDLNPVTKEMAKRFIARCELVGISVLIYCTLRDGAEQDALYAIGRTKPGDIVTNARAGESWHQFRCAFDFVPMVAGKPQWKNASLYAKCGAIGEEIGFEWAGRWSGKMKETAHMQFRGGLTLAQARAANGVA